MAKPKVNALNHNRNGMATGGQNTNDDREIDENYDKMRYDEKYDECNFRDRVSRNPSVSGLIDKNVKEEPNLSVK